MVSYLQKMLFGASGIHWNRIAMASLTFRVMIVVTVLGTVNCVLKMLPGFFKQRHRERERDLKKQFVHVCDVTVNALIKLWFVFAVTLSRKGDEFGSAVWRCWSSVVSAVLDRWSRISGLLGHR